jgi:hypothetical protein
MKSPHAIINAAVDDRWPRINNFSWDTEGGARAACNLLRAAEGITLRIFVNGVPHASSAFPTVTTQPDKNSTCYSIAVTPAATILWEIKQAKNRLVMTFSLRGDPSPVSGLELLFAFDPRMAATTVLPAKWDRDGWMHLPAVLSAPDFGQMLLSASPAAHVKGFLSGSRADHLLDFTLRLSVPAAKPIRLSFTPLQLSAPAHLHDPTLWPAARRGWFNAIQPAAQWGEQDKPFSAPPGILANNVLSDPVSCLISLWADHILLTPDFSARIKLPVILRHTLDWWFDHRTKATGEVYAYWDYADMLDANASLLIAAWDYVEASGEHRWLHRRIAKLELIADYIISRDVDDDGLIESTHSGNYGTLIEPIRGDSAWDTINSGHKNAYCNALIYRAFGCLADLEKQLGRTRQQTVYQQRAERLKVRYFPTLYNSATGLLAWWQSADGELHDLLSPMINSLAICYGLVDPTQGREILLRLWDRIDAVRFTRFDLGVPLTLAPVCRGDYLIGAPGTAGIPAREDGSDTFGQYLNGGCCVSDAVYFITALYMVGESEKGDRILQAMLNRQQQGVFPNGGSFQNGVVNAYPQGAEFYTWQGETCGYEGHLSYSFSFLQALLLREPAYRRRLLRPLLVQ